MQPLSTLPNREGFKFRGIRKDGGRYMNCRLKQLPGGMYICAAGRYVYEDVSSELAGWEPHPKRAEPSTYGEQDADFQRAESRGLLRGQTYRPA